MQKFRLITKLFAPPPQVIMNVNGDASSSGMKAEPVPPEKAFSGALEHALFNNLKSLIYFGFVRFHALFFEGIADT